MQPAVALPNIILSTPFAQLSWWFSSYKAWAMMRVAHDMLSHSSNSHHAPQEITHKPGQPGITLGSSWN